MAFLGFVFWIFIIIGILGIAANMLDAESYFGGFILIFFDAILALALWACIQKIGKELKMYVCSRSNNRRTL